METGYQSRGQMVIEMTDFTRRKCLFFSYIILLLVFFILCFIFSIPEAFEETARTQFTSQACGPRKPERVKEVPFMLLISGRMWSVGFGVKQTWVCILALLPATCQTSNKSYHFYENVPPVYYMG